MAIARPLRGFNDLGRSVTLIFLSMGHFSNEKMKKIYRVGRSFKFLQNAPSNSVHLTFSFNCAAV